MFVQSDIEIRESLLLQSESRGSVNLEISKKHHWDDSDIHIKNTRRLKIVQMQLCKFEWN